MMKRIAVKGLNGEEYEAIKQAAKEELPFSVNIRYWKRQYAYGAIDIRPKAPRGNHDPFFRWTEEEFTKVLEFVRKHNMLYSAGGSIEDVQAREGFDKFRMQYIVYSQGFNFMMTVVN